MLLYCEGMEKDSIVLVSLLVDFPG